VTQSENLYHSEAAVGRFKALEQTVRERQLSNIPFALARSSADTFLRLSAADKMLASPLFGAWLDRIAQAVHNPSGDPLEAMRTVSRRIGYIGNYAIAAALTGGEDAEESVRLKNGHVMIPELGRAALNGDENSWVKAEVANGALTLTSSQAHVVMYQDVMHTATEAWEPLRYIGPDDCKVALNDIDPNRKIFRYPVAERLDDAQFNLWNTTFNEAWDCLQKYDPYMARIVQASLNTIVPAPPEPLTHGKSMAAGAAFGVIGINENRDPFRLASHLVFGTRKHLLIALRGESPELYHPEDNSLATLPVYPPSREGHGIAPFLQDDSFVNIGLARFFSGLTGQDDPTLRAYGELSFTRWYAEARQNLDALHASGYVLDANRELVAALEEEMAALAPRFNAMPNAAKQAVEVHTYDRYLSWRVHNITPDRQVVAHLRNVWLHGSSCPNIIVPCELSKSIAAYTHLGQRNRYVLAEVRTKEPDFFTAVTTTDRQEFFATSTAGDVAFARSDICNARRYFAATIRQQPSSAEAWAGLALTFTSETSASACVLTRQPELVTALYAAIDDTTIEPEALAAWLAPSRMAAVPNVSY